MAKRASTKSRKPREIEIEATAPQVPPIPAPLDLGEIAGQQRAIRTLDQALAGERLHHAWIFHGPVGVGKFTTALAFAAVLLDPEAQPDLAGSVRAPEASRTASLLASGAHPDLHVIRRELAAVSSDDATRRRLQTNIPIEVVREFMVEPAAKTPLRPAGPGARASQVFIVDEAELLSRESQDTILKTLEEPGPGTVLILVTSSESELRPTIRSRCQRLAFPPLDADAMQRWVDASDLDLGPLDEKDRVWLMAYADGSPGRLASAFEHGLEHWPAVLRPLLEGLARRRPHPLAGQMFAALMSEAADKRVKGQKSASKSAANQLVVGELAGFIGAWLRGGMGMAAAKGSADRWARAITAVGETHRMVENNVNVAWIAEALAVRLADAFEGVVRPAG